MTTAANFIKDTLGLLQVVDVRQPVKDEDMQTGLRFLNRLCTRMEANTITLGWADVSSPSDTLSLPVEAELGIMYQLAMVLAPQYGVAVPGEVAAGAEAFMADLRRDVAVANPIRPLLDAPTPDRWHQFGPRSDINFV